MNAVDGGGSSGLTPEVLIDAILEFLADHDLLALWDIRAELEREIDRAGAKALLALDVPDTWVLPAGLVGSELLFPVDGSTLSPARAVLQLGRPFRADALVARTRGDRRLTMDVIGLAVAETLPAAYRGAYSNADRLPAAKTALRELRATA
jgi:hypothetical protein